MQHILIHVSHSFVEDPRMSWFESDNECKRKGGKLVEIDSEEENAALVEEIKRRGFTEKRMNFWLGLTDLGNEGDWRLASNGEKPEYENWHLGQPNNGGENQNCARLRIGPLPEWKDTWSDIKCTSDTLRNGDNPSFSMHALCEFERSTKNSQIEGNSRLA